MNLLTALVALRVTRLNLTDRSYASLVSWLEPQLRYGHDYPISYELSRALHDHYFTGNYLGVHNYNLVIRADYLTHLTPEEQKDLTSWIYGLNISHTPPC